MQGIMPQTVSKKRPASSLQQLHRQGCTTQPVGYEPVEYESSSGVDARGTAEWAQGVPELTTAPCWARHLVQLLTDSHFLKRTSENTVSLQVWSDCTGLATEMFSSRELSKALLEAVGINVQWTLHCACEKDRRAREFIKANHSPKHCSDDMMHRNFEEGKYWCEICMDNHELPRQGIDVYLAGYPCSPWSRKGFSD